MAKKPAKKPGLPSHLVPGNPGNSGGKRGRSGRKPDEFKRWCGSALYDARWRREMEGILHNRDHAYFIQASRLVAEYGADRPPEEINVSVNDEREEIWGHVIRELRAIRARKRQNA